MTGVVIAGGSGENGRITATRGRVLAREDHVGSRIWPALPPARGVPCRSGGPSPFVVLGSSSGSDSRLASPNRHDVRPSKPSRYDHVLPPNWRHGYRDRGPASQLRGDWGEMDPRPRRANSRRRQSDGG